MYILRDYLYDLIDKQKKMIKNLSDINAEEIRSIFLFKSLLSKCINDLIIENNEIINNKEENIIYNTEENNNLLFILTYIYDNCFNGGNIHIESIFPEFRNNDNSKISSFNNKISNYNIDKVKKKCLSSTILRHKK